MELKQFIKEALLSITNGVAEANEVNNRFKILGIKHNESGTDGNYTDFDVSVMVSEGSDSTVDGKAKTSWLNVVSAEVGSKLDKSNTYQNTQRLTFKIYISEK